MNLRVLGKTFKGVTDEMLAWQTERFTDLKTEDDGWVVTVRPEQVVEIAFDAVPGRSRTPVRARPPLPRRQAAAEADALDSVRAFLARGASRNAVTSFGVAPTMSTERQLAARVDLLRQSYRDIGGPTPGQWDRLLSISADRPVSLINLFKFRDLADYGDAGEHSLTGQEAFNLYAAVSGPALDSVGGRFVHLGSHLGTLVGDEESWDLVVVGEYPTLDALLALHENPAYRDAYRHRTASCADQRVLISG